MLSVRAVAAMVPKPGIMVKCFAINALTTLALVICDFKTNPAPIPHFVTKHIRQETPNGYMEQIVQIPNAQRIKAFCIEGECKCMGYVGEEPKCMRQFGVCANYLEHEF